MLSTKRVIRNRKCRHSRRACRYTCAVRSAKSRTSKNQLYSNTAAFTLSRARIHVYSLSAAKGFDNKVISLNTSAYTKVKSRFDVHTSSVRADAFDRKRYSTNIFAFTPTRSHIDVAFVVKISDSKRYYRSTRRPTRAIDPSRARCQTASVVLSMNM